MILNSICLITCCGLAIRAYSKDFSGGLVLTAFLLVLLPEGMAIDLGGLPTLTVHRLLILVTIVFWLRNLGIDRITSAAPFYRILISAAGFYLISTILSPYPVVGIKRCFYFLLEFVLLFCVVQTSVRDRKSARRIINAIGYGLLAVAALGFVERYLGWKVSTLFPEGSGGYGVERFDWMSDSSGDIHSTYRHRILFGVACALGAVKFLIDSAFQQGRIQYFRSLFCTCVCVSALYFSESRGPWLSFGLGSLFLFLMLPRRFAGLLAIIAVLTMTVLVVRPGVWATVTGLGQQTMDADTIRGGSFRWRLIIMSTALNQIEQASPANFLFGFGGGSCLMTDFGKVQISDGENLPLQSWDCEWAIVLYERGVVGFSCLVLLFCGAAAKIVMFLRRDRRNQEQVALFAATSMVMLIFMMTNVSIYAVQLIYLEVFVLAIASKMLQIEAEEYWFAHEVQAHAA